MGNATCCQGDHPDSHLEVDASVARPRKAAMAGIESSELEAGLTIRGVGLKEAISLQSALRGYLARRMISSLVSAFKPERDDIREDLKEIPSELKKLRSSLLRKLDRVTKDLSRFDGIEEYEPVLFKDGSVYSGSWSKESKRHGFGAQYWPNGKFYEGGWEDDAFSGKGLLITEKDDVYIGDFKKGKFHGNGHLRSADGSSYEGDWVSGIKHGNGKETKADNFFYEGGFKDGLYHGQGEGVWPNSNKYQGSWKSGKKEGEGIMTWTDREYQGSWVNDLQDGEGVLIDGKFRKKGEWNKGRRVRWLK
mmetsp:Transcript_2683/g.5986  ORF Transcript_2683/g.5986 Transcript_2683/m.5986 type:complete len:306 (+) Transcript_2683:28-945(+)